MFIVFQQCLLFEEVPSTCLPRNLPCLVFEFPEKETQKHFHYNILNDIKDHGTSSRNRNRGEWGNIKSRQRGPRGSDSVFYSLIWLYRMSVSSWTCQCARSSTLIVFESLFLIRSHGEYYLKVPVPLRVLLESTSRVSPTHYQGDNHTNLSPHRSRREKT